MSSGLTVREHLAGAARRFAAAGFPSPSIESQVLLATTLGASRARLVAGGGDVPDPAAASRFERLVDRRLAGVPAAYLTGEREFFSRTFAVDRRVLIPRPETEEVVGWALEVSGPAPRGADIGTGSGAVVVTLALEKNAGWWIGTDRSPAALDVAAANAAALAPESGIRFAAGDLCRALGPAAAGFDLIVSNPPYIPTEELDGLQREVRNHEPRLALDGGTDGLTLIRRLVSGARAHLRTGGWLVVEIGDGQGMDVLHCVRRAGGFDRAGIRLDGARRERALLARRG